MNPCFVSFLIEIRIRRNGVAPRAEPLCPNACHRRPKPAGKRCAPRVNSIVAAAKQARVTVCPRGPPLPNARTAEVAPDQAERYTYRVTVLQCLPHDRCGKQQG